MGRSSNARKRFRKAGGHRWNSGEGDVGVATNADLRLIARAIQAGWNVPESMKQQATRTIVRAAVKTEKGTTVVAAGKAAVEADRNVERVNSA